LIPFLFCSQKISVLVIQKKNPLNPKSLEEKEMTVLKTNRLVLRNWKEEDFPAFAKLNSDPRVMVYLAKCSKEESDNLAIERKKKSTKKAGEDGQFPSVIVRNLLGQ